MLNNLPKNSETIFKTKKHGQRRTFEALRKRTINKLKNPRLKGITFHTFRHWKGTMEYHKTKDIIHVMKTLGHKNIKSTMTYIHIEASIHLNQEDEWTCKIAANTKQASELIEAGFQFVAEKDNDMLFRKRK